MAADAHTGRRLVGGRDVRLLAEPNIRCCYCSQPASDHDPHSARCPGGKNYFRPHTTPSEFESPPMGAMTIEDYDKLQPVKTLDYDIADHKNASQLKPGAELTNHPTHYGSDDCIEVIKVIHAWGAGYNLGNVLKYICRAGKKEANYLQDLTKALWYLQNEIEHLESLEK